MIYSYSYYYVLKGLYNVRQVLECGIIKSTIISEVFVPIPDPSVTIANERTENYEFTSIIAVPPSFNAVGSGKNVYNNILLMLFYYVCRWYIRLSYYWHCYM